MTPTIEICERPSDLWLPGASMQPELRHSRRPRLPTPGLNLTDALLEALEADHVICAGAASSMYGLGRQKFAAGSISWTGDTIKTALVTNGYTPNLTTHEFLSDIGANTVGTDQTLASKACPLGVCNADPATWGGAASPPSSATPITYILIYKSTGSAGTSPLIGLIDTATNLPLTPNGGSVSVTWSTGANKIFVL